MLLDRDGTLIRDVPFLNDPDAVTLLPGVGEGLAQLQAAGFALATLEGRPEILEQLLTAFDALLKNNKPPKPDYRRRRR